MGLTNPSKVRLPYQRLHTLTQALRFRTPQYFWQKLGTGLVMHYSSSWKYLQYYLLDVDSLLLLLFSQRG